MTLPTPGDMAALREAILNVPRLQALVVKMAMAIQQAVERHYCVGDGFGCAWCELAHWAKDADPLVYAASFAKIFPPVDDVLRDAGPPPTPEAD